MRARPYPIKRTTNEQSSSLVVAHFTQRQFWRRPWGALCAFTASAIGWFRSLHSPPQRRAGARRSASAPWSSPRSPATDYGRLHHSRLPRPSGSGVWSSSPTNSVHCASTRRKPPRRPQRSPLLLPSLTNRSVGDQFAGASRSVGHHSQPMRCSTASHS